MEPFRSLSTIFSEMENGGHKELQQISVEEGNKDEDETEKSGGDSSVDERV